MADFARDDLIRSALLRCRMPFCTALSTKLTAGLRRLPTSLLSVVAAAARNVFRVVRKRLVDALLRSERRAVWRMRFIADL